jgi:hypothetical protein
MQKPWQLAVRAFAWDTSDPDEPAICRERHLKANPIVGVPKNRLASE